MILEARKSSIRFFLPLLAFLPVLVIYTAQRPGVYLWSDISWAFNQASALINPLVVGLFAFEAARRETARFDRRLAAAVRPTQARLLHLVGSLTWVVVAYVLAFLYAVAYMTVHDGYGAPIWTWQLGTVLSTVVWASLGYAVGRFAGIRWYVFAGLPIISYFVWLFISGPSRLQYWLVQLYPTALNGTNPFVKYIYSTIIGQIAWYLGLVVIVLVLLLRYLQPTARVSLLIAAVCVSALGVGAVMDRNGQFTTGYNARDYVCGSGQPVVCVNPGYKKGVLPVEAAFRSFDSKVQGTPLVVARLEQQVQGVGDSPSRGARSLYLEDLGPNYPLLAVAGYVDRYSGEENCRSTDPTILHLIIQSWLSGERDPLTSAGGPVQRAARWFDGQSASQKNIWLQSHYSAVRECRLTYVMFK